MSCLSPSQKRPSQKTRRESMIETFALDATHVRLLCWLHQYPFQRLEDLVVALGTWSGRTTIYTHVRDLERAQFIESLRGVCPGKVLYILSPLGSTWYLVSRQPSLTAPALREARASERTALLRLAPR